MWTNIQFRAAFLIIRLFKAKICLRFESRGERPGIPKAGIKRRYDGVHVLNIKMERFCENRQMVEWASRPQSIYDKPGFNQYSSTATTSQYTFEDKHAYSRAKQWCFILVGTACEFGEKLHKGCSLYLKELNCLVPFFLLSSFGWNPQCHKVFNNMLKA